MRPENLRTACLAGFTAAAALGCATDPAPPGDGPLIAEVGERRLFLGDALGVVAPGTPAADSLAALAAFAERWARDAVVTEAAETADLGGGADVERLVADYRDRLLRLRYEARFAAEATDTTVGSVELERLYAAERPLVDAPGGIARVILLRYGGEVPDEEAFLEDWSMLRRDSLAKARVLAHGRAYADLALTDETQWREVGAVAALAGGLDPERIRDGANVRRRGAYLRVLDYVGPGEPAPLAYVRDRLRQTALTERRADVLAAERDRLYQLARSRDAVKIYLTDE